MLEEVCFAYSQRPDFQVLTSVSLVAVPGNIVALVGESGAGKTTIVRLLERYYDPVGLGWCVAEENGVRPRKWCPLRGLTKARPTNSSREEGWGLKSAVGRARPPVVVMRRSHFKSVVVARTPTMEAPEKKFAK